MHTVNIICSLVILCDLNILGYFWFVNIANNAFVISKTNVTELTDKQMDSSDRQTSSKNGIRENFFCYFLLFKRLPLAPYSIVIEQNLSFSFVMLTVMDGQIDIMSGYFFYPARHKIPSKQNE